MDANAAIEDASRDRGVRLAHPSAPSHPYGSPVPLQITQSDLSPGRTIQLAGQDQKSNSAGCTSLSLSLFARFLSSAILRLASA